MVRQLIVLCGIVVSMSTDLTNDVHGQQWYGDHSLEYDYPERYEKISAKDWSMARARLDGFLELEIQDFKDAHVIGRCADVVWTLRRLARIDWPEDQRSTVAGHLREWTATLLKGRGFLERGKRESRRSIGATMDHPLFLPEESFRAVLAIDENQACKSYEDLWPLFAAEPEKWYCARLKSGILDVLLKRYKSERAYECIKRIQSVSGARAPLAERDLYERFLRRRAIFLLNDQRKAWAYLWQEQKEKGSESAVTKVQRLTWHSNITDMLEVFGALDMGIPFSIAMDERAGFVKRYVFLHASCCVGNSSFVPNANGPDPKKREAMLCLVGRVEAFFAEHPDEMLRIRKNHDDYLQLSVDALKKLLDGPQGDPISGVGKEGAAGKKGTPNDSTSTSQGKGGTGDAGATHPMTLRPEERGPTFSGFSKEQLLRVFQDREDRIPLRKAAMEVGDRVW